MRVDEPGMARLMSLAQGGDRQAYSALLTACSHWLKRYFCRRVAPSSLDDLVQDTLLTVHRKLSSYDPTRPFERAYLLLLVMAVLALAVIVVTWPNRSAAAIGASTAA